MLWSKGKYRNLEPSTRPENPQDCSVFETFKLSKAEAPKPLNPETPKPPPFFGQQGVGRRGLEFGLSTPYVVLRRGGACNLVDLEAQGSGFWAMTLLPPENQDSPPRPPQKSKTK